MRKVVCGEGGKEGGGGGGGGGGIVNMIYTRAGLLTQAVCSKLINIVESLVLLPEI